jgi:DNA-binding NarL/FixJ family response regulator
VPKTSTGDQQPDNSQSSPQVDSNHAAGKGIRVIVADDHSLMRKGLAKILVDDPTVEVVGTAENGEDAVAMALAHNPDVVVMDIDMPLLNGIQATKKILEELPETKVIGLSNHEDMGYVAAMFEAGASGYLLKHCAAEDLVRAITAVVGNLTFLSPQITTIVMNKYNELVNSASNPGLAVLTNREKEVLTLVAEGYASKEIALDLDVSLKTIEAYRQSIMKKLNLHSVSELTKFAIREGLTDMDV